MSAVSVPPAITPPDQVAALPSRPRARHRRPSPLGAAVIAWAARRTCGHHWHHNPGDPLTAWSCCGCHATRDTLPCRNGRACVVPAETATATN